MADAARPLGWSSYSHVHDESKMIKEWNHSGDSWIFKGGYRYSYVHSLAGERHWALAGSVVVAVGAGAPPAAAGARETVPDGVRAGAMSCSTPGCRNPAGALSCPACLKLGLPPSRFCSQACFKGSWKQHKKLHKLAAGPAPEPAADESFTYTFAAGGCGDVVVTQDLDACSSASSTGEQARPPPPPPVPSR